MRKSDIKKLPINLKCQTYSYRIIALPKDWKEIDKILKKDLEEPDKTIEIFEYIKKSSAYIEYL